MEWDGFFSLKFEFYVYLFALLILIEIRDLLRLGTYFK